LDVKHFLYKIEKGVVFWGTVPSKREKKGLFSNLTAKKTKTVLY